MIGGLIASVALLLANAFFVAVEFSLITALQTKLEPLAEQGGKRARLALRVPLTSCPSSWQAWSSASPWPRWASASSPSR